LLFSLFKNVGGFVFDSLTMVRIDSLMDLSLQLGYLAFITFFLVAQARLVQGRWQPAGWIGKIWMYETELIHFCYGGLLSGYVVFYFKSSSFSRSFVFLALIALIMILNEMPQVKKLGHRMRLGLYAFCVASYLNYLLPVVIGRMGLWIFMLALGLASLISFYVVKAVARFSENPKSYLRQLCISPFIILLVVFALYILKLIPPVPLSLKHLGIYRSVERVGDRYKLLSRKPSWFSFWKTDDHIFFSRPGDNLISFVSVFAPRRFSHQIFVRWSQWNENSKKWVTSDRVRVTVAGGRDQGFRGFVKKENYLPGLWQVEVETEDERVLGSETFTIQPDAETSERQFQIQWL
jgi:hypothetical protein